MVNIFTEFGVELLKAIVLAGCALAGVFAGIGLWKLKASRKESKES